MYSWDFLDMKLKWRAFDDKRKELQTFETVERQLNDDISKLHKEEVIFINGIKLNKQGEKGFEKEKLKRLKRLIETGKNMFYFGYIYEKERVEIHNQEMLKK